MSTFRRFVIDLAAEEKSGRLERNPPPEWRSPELRTLYFMASERDAAERRRLDPRVPPERKGEAEAVSLEELYAAGRDLGLEGYELERFVENAGAWA